MDVWPLLPMCLMPFPINASKEAWDVEDVLELIRSDSGKAFDPKIVDLFLDNLDDMMEIFNEYAPK